MTQPDLFRYHNHPNASESKVARDEALATVSHNNIDWMATAVAHLHAIALIRAGLEVTGERVKAMLLSRGIEQPSHVNAWGALIRSAAAAGIIEDTGRVTQTTTKQSHARLTRVWRFK